VSCSRYSLGVGEGPPAPVFGLARVAPCRLLLQKPDISLIDEPANAVEASSLASLEHYLQT
jgi:hypothetical protein